ncbi:hypothetical protein MKEN_00627800 [Mycena kentingensis (nom. inval.)]|nr:hypothetical protein MKEN_00627800 [Mycena kentingensis (nom. inval.)]
MLAFLAIVAVGALAAKPIHSHNDYLQAVPFWTAFNLSIMSVEADVWWQSNQLFVAHTSGEISSSRTLQSLYLNPILGIINGSIPVASNRISPSNPFQLLIDMKSSGASTYQPVVDALSALRAGGHLTTYHAATKTLKQGAVTVVGTGNTPLASVLAQSPRDVFFDADIRTLFSSRPVPTGSALWGPEVAPLASVDWSSVSNTAQMAQLVLNAHDLGIRTRFWDTPSSVSTWNTFWAAGSDWVNADSLKAVSDAWAAFDSALAPTVYSFTGLGAGQQDVLSTRPEEEEGGRRAVRRWDSEDIPRCIWMCPGPALISRNLG